MCGTNTVVESLLIEGHHSSGRRILLNYFIDEISLILQTMISDKEKEEIMLKKPQPSLECTDKGTE